MTARGRGHLVNISSLAGVATFPGLATYGAAGVTHVVDMLRTELEMAMALLGAPALADLTPDLLWD